MADIVQYLALPCLIVARSGLGTINHCLLTEKIAKQYGLHVTAFLLNRFPEKAAETAAQYVCEELAQYTDTPVVRAEELPQLTAENLAGIFQDKIERVIG